MAEALSTRFRTLADGMDKEIESKMHPATERQNMTRRRLNILQGMRQDGERLQKIQVILRKLAEMHDNGGIPVELQGLKSKAAIREALWQHHALYPHVIQLLDPTPLESPINRQIRELKEKLFGNKIPGFFPTPPELVDRMLSMLPGIEPEWRCLEPEAGMGDIADKIQPHLADWNRVQCCEVNYSLREILLLKNYALVGDDFLELQPESDESQKYDLIVMNPPFELGMDMLHIQHAHKHLASNGVLIALASVGTSFRNGPRYASFQDFLQLTSAHVETIEAGAFRTSFRSTGVACQLIVIGL